MSGPVPAWIAAAIFGWTSLLATASTDTWAPVSLTNPSSTCFLKNGSASGTNPAESMTEIEVPFRFGVAGLEAGAACVAAGAWAAAGAEVAAGAAAGAAGFAASAGLAASAGFGASVGLA